MEIFLSITRLPSGLSGLSASARRTGCSITQQKVPEPVLLFTVFRKQQSWTICARTTTSGISSRSCRSIVIKRKYKSGKTGPADALGRGASRGMPETTPLIKAALNLRVGAGFDVYFEPNHAFILWSTIFLKYCTSYCNILQIKRRYIYEILWFIY